MKVFSLFISIFFVLLSNRAMAEETRYGLGVGLNQGVSVFVPIKFNNWLIEPSLYYYKDEDETGGGGFFAPQKTKEETIKIGVGIFTLSEIADSANLYMGVRFGYTKTEREQNFGGTSVTTKTDGYFIGPTVGLQYLFNSNFSVALEASLYYEKEKGDTNTGFTSTSVSDETTSTRSQVILRYVY